MKKVLLIFLTAALVFSVTACSKTDSSEPATQSETSESTTVSTTEQTTQTTSQTTTTTTTSATQTTTKKETTTKKPTTTKKKTTTKKVVKGDVFSLSYKGKTVKPNDNMKKVLKKIGKPGSKPTKSESCMDTGYDLIYTYSGFEIESFCNDSGKETVVNINITGKNVETANGLKVGAKTKDAIKKTGLKFVDDGGVYIYTKGDCQIEVTDAGGKIESIFISSTRF